ncbi:MAG TPA: hypothetical protein VK461_08880 [Acidimicrobiales bacterium]|nr:hypothetical protein [Acidimicrobiales bacterium]
MNNRLRTIAFGTAMAGTALVGGAFGASLIGTAGAQTTSSSSTTTDQSTSASNAPPADQRPAPDWSKGGHQANGITETLLTGDDLTKAEAAAEAAVPGATAERAETDAEGAAYEVHMTKTDGSIVTVKLDSTFTVTETIDGMG